MMQRRNFLKAGLAAGTATLAAGCVTPPADHRETEGRLTARALTEAYLARMDAVDAAGPRLNSVIERNPDALAAADALDRERKEGGFRGPLHGIPVLIKDNIATADRMETTAGSLALVGSKPPRDAAIVARLREAGAVILGKTNLSEWANFRSTHSTSGWSGRGGQTKNPYALDRNPCGSSSGSGAAASANLCAVTIGTETDGSIVSPSSICGIVGIKPTVGLASRSGIIPISASQDTAGPMTRTVADAAALLTVIAGMDALDPATTRSNGKASGDYTAFLDANALQGARLGVVRSMFTDNEHVVRVMGEALAAMKKLGAEVIDPVQIESHGKVDESEFKVLLYEFKTGLNEYLASLKHADRRKTLADIIAFNDAHRDREMPYFGQDIFLQAQAKGPLTAKEYLDAMKICRQLSTVEGIDAVMGKHRLDALVAPTTDPAYPTDLVLGDHYTGGGAATLPAVAGYPHITVPAGRVFGLPFGVSFFGRAWSEPRLIGIAYAFEQATKHRVGPRFLPTVEFKKNL
jgi:amidase